MRKSDPAKKENRTGVIVVLVILLFLGGTLFVRYRHLKNQYDDNTLTIGRLEKEYAAQEARAEQLQQQEAYQQTDAYVEETARKLLNMIQPGDTTIKPTEE